MHAVHALDILPVSLRGVLGVCLKHLCCLSYRAYLLIAFRDHILLQFSIVCLVGLNSSGLGRAEHLQVEKLNGALTRSYVTF